MKAVELIISARNEIHFAHDEIFKIKGVLKIADVRNVLKSVRAAACSLTALESLLAGQPQPKLGD